MVDLGVLPCRLDPGIAHRAAIGLLVLATDQTMEQEFRRLVRQDGVALYEARLWNDNDVTPAILRAMRERIAPAAELILPGVKLDVVFVSCTSLRLSEIVADVEAEIGIPVTSSDHAMAWHCLRLAGVEDVVPDAGRLFER
jgi:maleate isomerase